MRYSRVHKEQTRQKLVANARAVAKRDGFATTGVDSLMASIGLSGAAFYGHFASKEALLAALVEDEMVNSLQMLAGDGTSEHAHVARRIRSYLSSAHALNPEGGCVLPTLGGEIARSGPEVRSVVERGLKSAHQSWEERLGNGDAAWALMSQLVGALVLARAVESDKTRKEILASTRRSLEHNHEATLVPTKSRID